MDLTTQASGRATRPSPPDRCPLPAPALGAAADPGPSRRAFLTLLLGAAASLGLAGLIAPIARFAFPVVRTATAARVKVGTLSQLEAAGGEIDIEYQEIPAALLRLDDGRVVGVSRVCTHLGCIIKWDGQDRLFRCPCHAGIFTPTGEVVSGPPPAPLAKLVVVEKSDEIWVEGWQSA